MYTRISQRGSTIDGGLLLARPATVLVDQLRKKALLVLVVFFDLRGMILGRRLADSHMLWPVLLLGWRNVVEGISYSSGRAWGARRRRRGIGELAALGEEARPAKIGKVGGARCAGASSESSS